MKTVWNTILALAVGTCVSAASVPAITQPSEKRTQAFDSPGIVMEVLVKEGDAVKAGQVLARQENRMDARELEARRIEAESNVDIDSAEAEVALRKVQYERRAENPDGFNPVEIEESRLAFEVAKLKVEQARQKKGQNVALYERQKIKLELSELRSKIDGIVEKITVDAGEMADPQKPEGSISIINNDPLWIQITDLRTSQAARLKKGEKLRVRHEVDGESGKWEEATIIFIAPMADASSFTQLVRLALPNPTGRASGMSVQVEIPDDIAALGAPVSSYANDAFAAPPATQPIANTSVPANK